MSNKEYLWSFFFRRPFGQRQDEVEQEFAGLSKVQRGWYPCTHPRPIQRRFQQLLDEAMATQDIVPWHPVLCMVLPSVCETFVAAMRTITHGTRFAIRDLSAEGGSELRHTHLNFSMNHLACMWNIHVITYNAITERSQRNPSSSPRQLTDCTWKWGIFDESHRYKTPKSIGWKVAMEAKIGFKVQVTTTPAYHSLRDWTNISRSLFDIPNEVEMPDSVSYHGPIALAKAVANVQREVSKALPLDKQQAAAQAMIEVVRPWTIRRWTESKLESGAPLVAIPTEIIHQVTLEWTPEEQEHLAAVAKRLKEQALTDLCGWVVWRVHRWQLACFTFPLKKVIAMVTISGRWSGMQRTSSRGLYSAGFEISWATSRPVAPPSHSLTTASRTPATLSPRLFPRRLSSSARYLARYAMYGGGSPKTLGKFMWYQCCRRTRPTIAQNS